MICLFSLSCNNGDKSKSKGFQVSGSSAPCEERSKPLDIIGRKDTLKILMEFSDYGEWGEHKELIYLQRNKGHKVFARLIVDTVSCDKIVEKNGIGVVDDNNRHIIIDTTKILTVDDEKVFSIFLQRLLELYLKNEMHANAGAVYHVINTDKSLDFKYWNSGDCRDTYYGKIREILIGNKMKTKNK